MVCATSLNYCSSVWLGLLAAWQTCAAGTYTSGGSATADRSCPGPLACVCVRRYNLRVSVFLPFFLLGLGCAACDWSCSSIVRWLCCVQPAPRASFPRRPTLPRALVSHLDLCLCLCESLSLSLLVSLTVVLDRCVDWQTCAAGTSNTGGSATADRTCSGLSPNP